ncbi:hypothetical protein COO59_11315 [Mixta theicola]|uniref:Uncharacterized protein n=1 Tax=Mixta theicola TaxID=1458355 RepID=A0A2K1Q988_9GAMM|nr:hypothetical protein COO59_11315 [Mixta theicola]
MFLSYTLYGIMLTILICYQNELNTILYNAYMNVIKIKVYFPPLTGKRSVKDCITGVLSL